MEKRKILDILDLGQNTFNFHYNNLKATKTILKNNLSIIESFNKLITEQKQALDNIFKQINKFSDVDKPFSILKKTEIIINLYYKYHYSFLDTIMNTLDSLKKSNINMMTIISDYLNFSQSLGINIKGSSEKYYQKYYKLMESLEQTEMAILEDYTKSKYKICINKVKNKEKSKEKFIKESLFLEKEFLNSEYEMNNKIHNYIDEYNSKLKFIRNKMLLLNDDIKNYIINMFIEIKQKYNNFITIINNESLKINDIDNNENIKKEIEEYLNYQIKKNKDCEILNALNLDKYNIKIINNDERNEIEAENYISQLKSKKSAKSLTYTSQDLYNIVKIIYDCNFKMVNKDSFNLDEEEIKINIKELMWKLVKYNFEKHEHIKEKKITDEEKKLLMNLIFSKDEFFIQFLICLNNYRTTGNYEMEHELFEDIKLIFNKEADLLQINNNKKISHFMIILSQTFFIIKDNDKYFLQNELKKKIFFRTSKFWFDHIDDNIQIELTKFEENTKRNGLILTEDKKKLKIKDIIFSKFASIVTSLGGFELEKETVDKILLPLFDKYNLTNEMKESIYQLIEIS